VPAESTWIVQSVENASVRDLTSRFLHSGSCLAQDAIGQQSGGLILNRDSSFVLFREQPDLADVIISRSSRAGLVSLDHQRARGQYVPNS
jgi:hypothetical protein